MQKTTMLAAILVLAASAPARAGGKEGTLGVGAEAGLNRVFIGGAALQDSETSGASVSYDAGKFHFGGFLGFQDGPNDNDTDYTFGGRFYYHLHDTTMSDFGVGGMIGFFSADDRGVAPLERETRLYFEPGVQIRAFIANNVALSFTAGLSFGVVDADTTVLTGQFNALGGVHYYFFK